MKIRDEHYLMFIDAQIEIAYVNRIERLIDEELDANLFMDKMDLLSIGMELAKYKIRFMNFNNVRDVKNFMIDYFRGVDS